MLASRMSRIASSPTMKGLIAADRLRSQGIDVVDLGAGEPDFPTPPHVKEAASRAISANFTKYTPVGGIPELREAIAQRLKEDDGRDYRPEQIVVGNGAKDILFRSDSGEAHRPAYDDIIQALTGYAWLNSTALGITYFVPSTLGDKIAALSIVQSVLAALFHRERTGRIDLDCIGNGHGRAARDPHRGVGLVRNAGGCAEGEAAQSWRIGSVKAARRVNRRPEDAPAVAASSFGITEACCGFSIADAT